MRLAIKRQASGIVIWAILLGVVWILCLDYQTAKKQAEQSFMTLAGEALEQKADLIEGMFRQAYQGARTISLLPTIRSLTGGNLSPGFGAKVDSSRFSPDGQAVVQQMYNNMAANLSVSEVYCVLDGFRPDLGQTPFFMYDTLIIDAWADKTGAVESDASARHTPDYPEELESLEYAFYVHQLATFKISHPRFEFDEVDEIPMNDSPIMRTCDNTQYYSRLRHQARDAEGMMFSVPIYAPEGSFSGIISVIIRTNVFEAQLLGVPFLPLTERDHELMKKGDWALPEKPARFVLENVLRKTQIYDRRFPELPAQMAEAQNARWVISEDFWCPPGMKWRLRYLPDLQSLEREILLLRIDLGLRLGAALILGLMFLALLSARQRAEKLSAEAAAANKTKSLFLASLSHEIRTPMSSIIWFSDLLDKSPLDATQKKYVDVIGSCSKLLLSLINNILDLSKLEAGKIELNSIGVDLKRVASDVLKIINPLIHKDRVQTELLIEPGKSYLYRGDPLRIQQILLNLLGNAAKFTAQGTIRLRLDSQPHETSPMLETVRFRVEDTGIGIDPGKLETIFDAYAQAEPSTSRQYGGSGLGLTIARSLARQMGGDVKVSSTPNQGSEFTLTLVLPKASPESLGPG